MPLQTPPRDPRLDALNERCQVRVENLIQLGEENAHVFFTARTLTGYRYHALGVVRGLVQPDTDGHWRPGDEGTPRVRISGAAEFFIDVTYVDGWSLKSAYSDLTVDGYQKFFESVVDGWDDPADPSEEGPFDA